MPGESKRVGSPQAGQSVERPTRRGPRTRSMAHKEAEQAAQSPANGEGGATGSEVNNDGGGSPSSNESPSPVQTKKPRRVTINEITEERETTATATTETVNASAEANTVEQERVVHYYTQYLCLSLWRAMENCRVWDYRLVSAFCQGPRAFASNVSSIARQLHRRLSGTGQPITPEDVTRSYLEMFRPRGLYNCCARILQGTMKAYRNRARPLKRKKPEPEMEMEVEPAKFSLFTEGVGPSKKYKHRFLMDPPRIIILNGPDKTGFDEGSMDE